MRHRSRSEAEVVATDAPSPIEGDLSNPLGLVPAVAWLGFVAVLVGKYLASAWYGVGTGLDRFFDRADLAADFITFAFAILALALTSLQLVHTARDKQLALPYRLTAIVLGALVVALVTPALPIRLPDQGLWMTALASVGVAFSAGVVAMRSVPTRALGLVLAAIAISASLHLGAVGLWGSPLTKTALLSRGLATASMVVDGLALLVAFLWLATRSKQRTSWPTLIALTLASAVFWVARQGGDTDAPLVVLAQRVVTELSWGPPSFFVPEVRQLLELAALALAGAALFVRTEARPIAASLSLLLVARPTADVPLSATALTLAALTAGLRATRS